MIRKVPLGSTLAGNITDAGAKRRETKVAKPLRNTAKDKVACTFFMSPKTHKRMQEIKIDRGTSLQQILEEAVDMWLAEQNEPEFRVKD